MNGFKMTLGRVLARLGSSQAKRAAKMRAPTKIKTAKNGPALEPRAIEMIAQIRSQSLTYCGAPKLENLADAVDTLRVAGVKGCFVEAGVALGGSAILLGQLKSRATVLELYDVYEMIPPPGDNDGEDAHRRYQEIASGQSSGLGDGKYYGYVDNLIDLVRQNLLNAGLDPASQNIHLIKGLFEDTLKPRSAVALAHIDCDWYDSVNVCIKRLAPMMASGGIMIFDDYSSYSGCRRAVDEFLAQSDEFRPLFHRRSLAIQRRGEAHNPSSSLQ